MLLDGTRGVVRQRDGQSYAIAPHLPCGMVSPEQLRRIADVAERFGATLKCTGAQRIAIIGLREGDVDAAWAMLGEPPPGRMCGNVVRSVRACPGTEFCKRARQDALGVGLELDRRYHGQPMPGKMKIGISGCGNQCSDTAIKDIGLVGGARGWRILVGGNGGTYARLARELSDREFSTNEALAIVDAIVAFYRSRAEPNERLGDTLARLGLPTLKQALALA